MSRLTIDLGTAGNPATGDSIRTAFNKVNTNFAELYAELGGDSLDTISFTNNTISSGITNGTLVLEGNGTGAVDIEGIQVNDNQIITTTTNANLLLDGNGTGTVVINGLSFPIADGTAGQVLKTDGAGNLSFTAVDPGAITIVGDDSSGTAVNIGETFKIAGAGSVTTAVSGDTLTITGTSSSTGDFVFSGNTLSTASSNADMELDPAGTGNLILKSGNFLPATDNTQYLGSVSKRWHTLYVGPGSININGVTISESGGLLQIPGGFTGTQGLASIILPDPNNLPYGNQNDNLGAPFDFDTATIFYDHHTYLYIANKVASGGVWSGWTVGQNFPESLGFTPATFLHYSIGGALTQLILLTGGSGLSNVATDNVMAFRPGDPITTVLATPYSGVLGTVNAQGTSQPSLTTTSTLTSGGTFTAQDESLFFDNINLQNNANIVFPDSTTQQTAASIIIVGDDSTGTTFNAGETIKIAGTSNITTAVSGDTLTITGPDLSSYLTSVPSTIEVNEISSADSTAIQINDAINVSGLLTANAGLTINNNSNTWSFGSDGNLTVPSGKGIQSANGGYQASITLNPYRVLSQTIEPDDNSYSVANNDFGSATWTDIGFGSSTITLTTPENYVLDFISTELSLVNNVTVRINGAGAEYPYSYSNGNEIILTGAPADGPIDVTAIRFSYQRISKIHIEPDDGVFDIISRAGTHIDIDAGNDLRMTAYDDVLITAGGQIRLRSGDDYVEITTNYDVPNATSQVWRFGTDGVLTFPDSTTQSTAATITVVGDDSTGTTLNAGETIRIAGTQNITTAVSGDTLTITGSKNIDVNEISSGDSSAIQINDAVNVSGAGTFHGSVRFNAGYTEKINALTSSSTITVNCALASIHTVTLAVSTGFVISNLPTGGTVTLIITQGGSGSYTATFGTDGSTTVKFPGGAPTLSTAVGAIDVVTIFNDGTNYLGNIAKAYAA